MPARPSNPDVQAAALAAAATDIQLRIGLDLHRGVDVPRGRVIAWAMFDWALQPFATVILTFVFTAMYLTSDVFLDQQVVAEQGLEAAQAQLSSGLGLAITIAGILIALVAPVLGQWADAGGHRKKWLFWSTALLLLTMGAMFFVEADPRFFWLGAGLVALGSVLNQVSETNYNAMIVSVASPTTVGRVSGLGWGMGYSGGVVALLLIAAGPLTDLFAVDEAAYDNGIVFRWIALASVLWAVAFGWPLFKYVPEVVVERRERAPLFQAYRDLFALIANLWRNSRETFWFLLSSAIFRDGLSGVFAFGAIIAAVAFGFSGEEVLIFGIAANLVAGVSTILVGRLDDRLGPRRVIVGALATLVAVGLLVVAFHEQGAIVFWIGGLILCCTVGPAQAASRSFLARRIPAGHESELFALYATTGKAASFIAPAMWTLFISLTGATIWGTLGILLVVLVGLVMLLVTTSAANDSPRRALPDVGQMAGE